METLSVPVDYTHKEQVFRSFDFGLNKLLDKQPSGWWFEKPWHACDTIIERLTIPLLKFRPHFTSLGKAMHTELGHHLFRRCFIAYSEPIH